MSDRIHHLNEQVRCTRRMQGWFYLLAAAAVLAATFVAPAGAAEPDKTQLPQDGLMLRPGAWTQEGGGYVLPRALDQNPLGWPTTGWYRVTHKANLLQVQPVSAPAEGLPTFLHHIAQQVIDPDGLAYTHITGEEEAEAIDTQYIRVPGLALAEGRRPVVPFSNMVLRPKLDHAYELKLGDTPFTLTVQNGLRSKAGVAYGQGAQYTVAYGGDIYTYQLGAAGWDTVVQAVADVDGDGKPDFFVQTDGGTQEYLLLSSKASPGKNLPTAVLTAQGGGC